LTIEKLINTTNANAHLPAHLPSNTTAEMARPQQELEMSERATLLAPGVAGREAPALAPPMTYAAALQDLRGNLKEIFYRGNAPRSGPSILILDGIRACAYLWVLVLHFAQRTKTSLGIPDAQQGVTAFFVLSGYLIAMIVNSYLRKSGQFWPTYCKFLAGRFFRIWPAYIVSIILLQMYYSVVRGYGLFAACGYPGGILRATVEYGLFLQNWLAPAHYGNAGITATHDPATFPAYFNQQKYSTMGAPGCMYKQASVAWTVQTEVNLYFITPPLVYLYHQDKRRGWAAVTGVLMLSLGMRFYVSLFHTDTLANDVNFFTRAFYMRANE
jgi:peptidoglycan/LPS O-acetylase OafA/YrhL